MHELRGNQDAALSMFLKAVDSLERDRRSLRDDKSRGTGPGDSHRLLLCRRTASCWSIADTISVRIFERARSRGLSDLLASRAPGLERPQEQQLFTQLMVLRTRIGDAQGGLVHARRRRRPRQRCAARNHRQADPYARGSIRHPQLPRCRRCASAPDAGEPAPATLKAFQQALRNEQSEALQYLVLPNGSPVAHHADLRHGEQRLPPTTGTDGQSRRVAEEPRRSLRRI